MRPPEDRRLAEGMIAAGLTDSEISRRTGIPRSTLSGWRRGIVRPLDADSSCEQCRGPGHDHAALPTEAYAYLLGQYLGDGYISTTPAGIHVLRVYCARVYPRIIDEVIRGIAAIRPDNRIWTRRSGDNCVVVESSSRQWACYLPQHGPGRKHTRPIVLREWQQRHVRAAPKQFVRGLIHSDGSRYVNRVHHGDREYRYVQYEFSNRSRDIQKLCCAALDQLGIRWRQMGEYRLVVSRRAAVARLDEFVGEKR